MKDNVPKERSRILMVSHNVLGKQPYGGVEIYQDSIRLALKDQFEFLFYVPDRTVQPFSKRYLLRDEDMHVLECFDCRSEIYDAWFSCREREGFFSQILRKYKIQLVHFQHLIGHIPSLGLVPRMLGIKSVFSLHDYYSVCRRFDLIDHHEKYCNVTEIPPETCDTCLKLSYGLVAGSQATRQAFFGKILQATDVLHTNTEGVAKLYRKIFPQLDASKKIEVFGAPMPLAKYAKGISVKPGPLQIAIIGNFTKGKGGTELIRAIYRLIDDNVEFTVFGRVSEPYIEIFKLLDLPNVKFHGTYIPGTLPRLMANYSMSIHFSIWPETYCIGLSEAWNAGLVPIVSDIGALGERVTDGLNGFKVPVGDSVALATLVRRLITDRTAIELARSNIHKGLSADYNKHMAWLTKLYRRLLPKD